MLAPRDAEMATSGRQAATNDDTRAQADADRPSPSRPGKAGAVRNEQEVINQRAGVSMRSSRVIAAAGTRRAVVVQVF